MFFTVSTKDSSSLKNRTANTMRNASIGLVSQLLQALGSFACRMVFVRCLSQEYLGVNGLFAEVISILSVAELGIGASTAFELYRALANNDEKLQASLMAYYKRAYYIIGLIIGIAGLFLLPFIDLIVNKDPAISESVYLLYLLYLSETVLSYFFSYKQTILQASQQNYILFLVEMTTGIVKNVTQIIILLLTHSFIYYLLAQIVFRLVNNVLLAVIVDKKYPKLRVYDKTILPVEVKKRLTSNMKNIFITNLFSKLVNSTDTIIISTLVGLSVAGVNSNYVLIISTMQMFTSKILDGVTGSIGNINATESRDTQVNSFNFTYLAFYWVLLSCTCGFVLLSSDAIRFFFGSNYLMPTPVVVIIGFNFFQQQLFNMIINYRATLGLFKYGRFTTLFTGVINIVLSVFFGKRIGVFGILIATFISRLLTLDWHYPLIVYKYGFGRKAYKFFVNSFIYWIEAFLIIAVCLLIGHSLPWQGMPGFVIKLFVSIIIPNTMIIFFNFRKEEYITLISKIKKYVYSKIKMENGSL